jgi:hypothetical protein
MVCTRIQMPKREKKKVREHKRSTNGQYRETGKTGHTSRRKTLHNMYAIDFNR